MMTLRSGKTYARDVDVIVIGGGHAGLAMSHELGARGVEHVVLERGEIASSWRNQRWDSLRLLTPNWQCRLPGYRYAGPDPHGFMTKSEVVELIEGYALSFSPPVLTHTEVSAVTPRPGGLSVATNRGQFFCRGLVLASGAHSTTHVPGLAGALPRSVASLGALDYKNPDGLDAGEVLVVGSSATGVQLAQELARSGRRVTLSVGEHIRLPRTYRGRDIQAWLEALGILDQRFDEVDDLVRARRVPSPQLVGSSDHASLDLNALRASGVELVGRLVGVSGQRAQFSGSLKVQCQMADLKLNRLLTRIDALIESSGLPERALPSERPAATELSDTPRLSLDLGGNNVSTVLWASGTRPDYSFLHLPVIDARGRLRHNGGVVDYPGVVALGLNFMRRRKSSFIHGAEDDVRELADSLVAHLEATSRTRKDRVVWSRASFWPEQSVGDAPVPSLAVLDLALRAGAEQVKGH